MDNYFFLGEERENENTPVVISQEEPDGVEGVFKVSAGTYFPTITYSILHCGSIYWP